MEMETRIDVQEKIDEIIDGIGMRSTREVGLPARHLLCIAYGSGLYAEEENCRQLYQNLARRYKSANRFQMKYFSGWDEGQVDAALHQMRENCAYGFVQNTTDCYIPIIFLMEDGKVPELIDFIFRLRRAFDRDGSFRYRIDLYALVNYQKESVAANWSRIVDGMAGIIHREVDDLYILSREGVSEHNIFSRAMDAIETNLFLKTGITDRTGYFRSLWEPRENREEVVGFECDWKVMSYWRMDLLVCMACKYVLEMLDTQLNDTEESGYAVKVSEKFEAFISREILSLNLLAGGSMLPVPEKEIRAVLSEGNGGFLGMGRLGRKQEAGTTVGQVLVRLYGDEDFFFRYAGGRIIINEERIRAFAEELLGFGTFGNIDRQLERCIRTMLEQAREEERNLSTQVRARLEEPVFSGAKSPQAFIQRLFNEVIRQHYDLFICREKCAVLERLADICAAPSFRERLDREKESKKLRQTYLNAIINSSMPQNGASLLEKMKVEKFYDSINWRDDVFEILKQDNMRETIRQIESNVQEFVERERDGILDMFKKEICRLNEDAYTGGGAAFTPLILAGNSYAPRNNKREYIFGNEFFLKLRYRKQDGFVSREFADIDMYSNEAFYPYTLEFFGLNDSINTCGVKGMHNEGEGAADGADW